ncbi:hypothetical protein D3C72_1275910 [compost metagenome]
MRDGGVHQQLVDQLAGVRGVQVDACDALAQPLGVGFVQSNFGLRAQRRQRRAHLVRGVGHQRVQGVHDDGQALHEGVQRLDQPPHFARHRRGDGGEVFGRARAQFAFQHGQRGKGALHAEPQQAQRHQGHDQQRQHAAPQDFVRQGFARTQRFRHAHRYPAGVLAGRHQAPHGGHAHGFVVIRHIGEDRRGRQGQRQVGGQVAVARDQPAIRGAGFVEDALAAGQHGQ